MTYTETRNCVRQINSIGVDDWREVLESALADKEDFDVEGYRFIDENDIDGIMQDELASDEYTLGCCTAWFIADSLDIPLDAVEKMQKAEVFEGLGALLAKQIGDVQENMVRHDGYGNHFAHYDGNENEININGTTFYAFRIN